MGKRSKKRPIKKVKQRSAEEAKEVFKLYPGAGMGLRDQSYWHSETRRLAAELGDNARPSQRLQMFAEVGALVRSLGPVEEFFEDMVNRMAQEGIEIAQPWRYEDQDAFREQMHTFHTTGRWAEYGFNVFSLSEDLAATFLLTEPLPVPEDGLALPFPVFVIRIPAGVVPFFVDGKQEWAETIWVHQFTGRHRIHGPTKFIRVSAFNKHAQVWRDRFPANIADAEDESIFNRTEYGDPAYVPEDQLSVRAAVQIVRNLVAWLDSMGGLSKQERPQPPRAGKSKQSRKKAESGVYPRVWLLGKDVKLRPELKRVASELSLGASKKHAPKGWRLRARQIIRGHWKQQPYGPQNSLRKLKRIEPYWRGPEGEAAWAHVYKDEQNGDDGD